MKPEEMQEPVVMPPRWVCAVLYRILPLGLRDELTAGFDRPHLSQWEIAHECVSIYLQAYRVQIVAGFNLVTVIAETAAVLFCFSAASVSLPLFIVLGTLLIVLSLRDAYRFAEIGSSKSQDPRTAGRHTTTWYYLDSACDAVLAAVFLLTSQALLLRLSPTLIFPTEAFQRAAFLCLPLLATLRMALRPNRGSEPCEKLSVEEVWRKTWGFNLCWITTAAAIVITNPRSMPASMPHHEFFSVMLPIVTFGMIWAIPQNRFSRNNDTLTLRTNPKTTQLERMKESLLQQMNKGQPHYHSYIGAQIASLVLVAMPLASSLWPWLSGRPEGYMLRTGFYVGALLTLLLSWNYLKRANEAAGQRLMLEIDRIKKGGA
jgi:hypothetical protein